MTVAPEKPQQAEDLVSVTIDGIEISVPKGTLLIRAAEMIGIQIPRFCDHPLLDPAGACRQCLVEVTDMGNGRGMPKPAASCTTTVMPGMVIKTQHTSPVADKAQQGVMELLLINHPLDCPVCDKGGECPLQNQAMSNGRAESRFVDIKRTFPKPIGVSAQVLLDRERCVLCQRCTRFSEQIAGDPFIDLLERGAKQQIGTSTDQPFQSYFSGNTVQICPVGALTSASYRFRARPFDLMSTPSICEHCSSGCDQRSDWRRGKITRRLAGNEAAVNEEWNCDKGRWAFKYAEQADRILTPLVRDKAGALVEASWPEALERAATGLRQALGEAGVGVLPGGRLTYEDAYAYAKFARVVLGTNDVDFRARPNSDEELGFLGAHIAGWVPADGAVTYADVEAAPVVLLAGFEPEEESPIVFLRLRKSTRLGLTKVYSIAALASNGLDKLDGTLLQTVPGNEAAVLAQLESVVLRDLGRDGALILVGERLAANPGALTAAAALAADTGARLVWVPRRAGDRGALDAGLLPNLLPGGRLVSDDASRAEVERVWDASIPTSPGRPIDDQILAAAAGGLSALIVGGVDPDDLTDPAAARIALKRVGFLVSLELRHSAVTELADVVFPVAPTAEKDGSFLNWEGRFRPFTITLAGTGALSDGRVLHALADELDVPLGLPDARTTRAELARFTPTVTRINSSTVPVGTAKIADPGEAVLATWPELIGAGRMLDGEPNLAGTAKPARALLSSMTASEIGVRNGDPLQVSGPGGTIVAPAVITDMPDRVVWLPTNSIGSRVRVQLGAQAGDVVTLSAEGVL
ncbi:MAG: NADH-quinone oxidoreductase, chain [Pseudonocardiales bacterium]|nr:NADH-quinone oxidoreductase, chain [Pseudonocardiales bacterium]